jgi:hypothetical protein
MVYHPLAAVAGFLASGAVGSCLGPAAAPSPALPMSEVPVLRGELRAFSIADVMGLLNMSRKSGMLKCKQLTVEKGIFWTEGDITFAVSNLPEDSLGEFLVARGRLTRAQLEQSSQKVDAHARLGKILVREGLLGPRDLWWAVQTQVLEIIYSLFQWDHGSFEMSEDDEGDFEKIQLSTSTQNIIMEGIRRLDEWGRIRERIPDVTRVPVLRLTAAEIARRVELREIDHKILQTIDGRRSVLTIVKESGLGEFETQLALLGLISAGYVELEAAKRTGASMATFLGIDDDPILVKQIERFNKFYSDLYASLEKKLGDETHSRIQALLEEPEHGAGDVLKGLKIDSSGRLTEADLLSNVADFPLEERARTLILALNGHLLAQFQEFGNILDKNKRAELYRTIQEYQQRWRK